MRLFRTSVVFLIAAALIACATPKSVKQSSSAVNQHLKSAAMSAAAYSQNVNSRQDLLSAHGLIEVKYVGLKETSANKTSTEYLVAENGSALYISFTGSNEKKDFLSLYGKYESFLGTSYPVHNGFVKAWKQVEKEILALVRQKKASAIIVSGHSKGGSVAGVAALALLSEGFPVTEVTTFGAPPIFKIPRDESDAAFKATSGKSRILERLNNISTHYVREYDYIQLASTGLSRNNRSVGQRLSLKDDGSLYTDPNHLGAAVGAVTNTAAAKVEKLDSKALHHHASTYLEILNKAR